LCRTPFKGGPETLFGFRYLSIIVTFVRELLLRVAKAVTSKSCMVGWQKTAAVPFKLLSIKKKITWTVVRDKPLMYALKLERD
jgi:hypothetical protein